MQRRRKLVDYCPIDGEIFSDLNFFNDLLVISKNLISWFLLFLFFFSTLLAPNFIHLVAKIFFDHLCYLLKVKIGDLHQVCVLVKL